MKNQERTKKYDPEPQRPRKVFRKLGTCSRTLFYILNREFEHPNVEAEVAIDPLAGGILARGHQCGMLWGASMAAGAEAYRRFDDLQEAMALAVLATRSIMDSFVQREGTINCREITHCDFSNNWSFAKYFLTGRFLHCFRLAEEWAPEAIEIAKEALQKSSRSLISGPVSCASEVARRMGASDEQMVMVAGFAGGLGLSGGGCGALAAAMWLNTLEWCREREINSAFHNPAAEATMKAFEEVTDGQILCQQITGEKFTFKSHNAHIEQGGCAEIMSCLTATSVGAC